MRRTLASLGSIALLATLAGCASSDQPTTPVAAVNAGAAARSPDADAEAQLRSLSHINSDLARTVANAGEIHAAFVGPSSALAPATRAELQTMRDQATRLAVLASEMEARIR